MRRVAGVLGVALGAGVLALTFLAYLNPSFALDLGSMMVMCAQWIGLR